MKKLANNLTFLRGVMVLFWVIAAAPLVISTVYTLSHMHVLTDPSYNESFLEVMAVLGLFLTGILAVIGALCGFISIVMSFSAHYRDVKALERCKVQHAHSYTASRPRASKGVTP